MRVIVQNNPSHPDNIGHIVTHLGMNLDQRLKEFKQFENDDQAFWEKVIGGEEPEVPAAVRNGSTRLMPEERPVVVSAEIVDSLWEEDFNTLEDAHIVAEIRSKLEALGLDPRQAEEIVRKGRPRGMVHNKAAEPFAVLPQRAWEEAKKRLYEKVNSTAKILLNNATLEMSGTELAYKYTTLSLSGQNNFACAVIMVNREVKKILGKERNKCSTEELQAAASQLDDILKQLVRQVKKVKSLYEQQAR
jgi:hypothetical protein